FATVVCRLPFPTRRSSDLHDPIRVVEELIMLDTFLGPDREVRMGVGRGLGRREFEGFGIHMDESRPRFQEAVDIIKLGLTEDRRSEEHTSELQSREKIVSR